MPRRQTRESVEQKIYYLPSGCAIFWGGLESYGRYRVRWEGRKTLVTRLLCEWHRGIPPTPLVSAQALHSCHHEWCVAWEHLRWGTQSENVLEMWDEGHRKTSNCPHGLRMKSCKSCQSDANKKWRMQNANNLDSNRRKIIGPNERWGMSKLTAEDISWIKSQEGNLSILAMSKKLKVSRTTIKKILMGEVRKHV